MTIDLVKNHIVVVNGGSGCIIQPMSPDYLYILTAKHNITDTAGRLEQLTRFYFENEVWMKENMTLASFVEGEDYFFHPDLDIAIIKIAGMEGFANAVRYDNISQDKNDYYLLGYPETRRLDQPEISEWYRQDIGVQIMDPRGHGVFEAQVPMNPTLAEIRGHSGGALLKIISGKIFLSGIQNKMAEEQEQMGRIRFTSMACFDEIISLFPGQLVPILPSYLASFSFLTEECFNLTPEIDTQATCEKLSIILRAKALEITRSTLVPHQIKDFIHENFPVFYQQEKFDHFPKKLWMLWLELLTALNIVKSHQHQLDDLPEILQKVRLFYADSDQDFWVENLPTLHERDYQGLAEGGTVVVTSNIRAYKHYSFERGKIPGNISQVNKARLEFEIKREGQDTAAGIGFPLDLYNFVTLSAFKEGSAEQLQPDFAEAGLADCINMLKQLYGQLIPE